MLDLFFLRKKRKINLNRHPFLCRINGSVIRKPGLEPAYEINNNGIKRRDFEWQKCTSLIIH